LGLVKNSTQPTGSLRSRADCPASSRSSAMACWRPRERRGRSSNGWTRSCATHSPTRRSASASSTTARRRGRTRRRIMPPRSSRIARCGAASWRSSGSGWS